MSTPTMRFDRLLASMGYGTRRDVEAMVYAERIFLDGAPLAESDQRIALTPDFPARVTVDGAPLDPLTGMVVMLHKPVGVTCSHKESGLLIYDLLPNRWKLRDPQLSSVGRLDKETSGMLLLTDDGALLHKIISPKHHVAKTYFVTLDRPLQGNEADIFAAGSLMLEREEKPLLPAQMQVLTPTTARVTVHEGRYHQIRRMFAAVGNHVVALHRETIGGLHLPADLPAGHFKLLSQSDIATLFSR